MMHKTMMAGLAAAVAFALMAGCGGGGSGSGGGPSGVATSLSVRADPSAAGASECAQSASSCDCPRGASAKLTLVAKDSQGNAVTVDPSGVAWTSSDTGAASLAANTDGTAVVTGNKDWFDTSNAEGTSTVGVSYDGLTASLPVNVVIDASGAWVATTDGGLAFNLALTQKGRNVKDTASGYGGTVQGDALKLDISIAQVSAHFTSRTEVKGTYSGSGGLNGSVTCEKK